MDIKRVSIREQLSEWDLNKVILDNTGNINDYCWNFWDWFCSDKSLERRAKLLMPKVKKFVKEFNVDIDKNYVWFKNNCPMYGSLYDDFRISDRETSNVLYTVTPKTGHYVDDDKKAEIWGRENDFDGPLFTDQNLSSIYKSLKSTIT